VGRRNHAAEELCTQLANDKSYLELVGEMYNFAGFVRNSAKDAEKPGARRIPRVSSIYICNSVTFDRKYTYMKCRTYPCTCIRIHTHVKSAWIFQQKSIGGIDSNTCSVGVRARDTHTCTPSQQGRNRAKER